MPRHLFVAWKNWWNCSNFSSQALVSIDTLRTRLRACLRASQAVSAFNLWTRLPSSLALVTLIVTAIGESTRHVLV